MLFSIHSHTNLISPKISFMLLVSLLKNEAKTSQMLKGNSSFYTQDSIIASQNFAIIEIKPYYWVGSMVTTLGHVSQFFINKRHNSLVFKDWKVFKFDLDLLNTYKPMYFDRNINRNKDGNILGSNYWVL